MPNKKKNTIDNEIIRLVKEAMKSGISKQEFSSFLKNKTIEKMKH
ncbi:hypothetical protein CJ195_04345 [Bacillus sp. UMB0899]|nr:anti-repressor SinI family protein [Metabacillus schmidteae]PMC39173.1 hypothetical protein CJ195_04345 [Bacillus sp. UMB0899]